MRLLACCCLVLALAACSAGIRPIPQVESSSNVLVRSLERLELRVHIPKRKHRGKRSRYVSPSTRGMTIALNGPTVLNKTLGLTPSSPGCTAGTTGTTCTVMLALSACPSSSNCYTGSVATYDAVSCATTCTIPVAGKELSADQSVAFNVTLGRKNRLALILDGIPATVVVVPGKSSTLSGTSSSGLTLSKCAIAVQPVSLAVGDADGNVIVGPNAPTVSSPTLSSDDTVHLAVATPAPGASPNAFRLVPPSSLVSATIPNARSHVHLTASITPSGASNALSSQVTVTFNGDVCGVVTEFSSGITPSAELAAITAGPDGNLWFTECSYPVGRVGKITTSGAVTEYTTGISSGAEPAGIVAGPDGNLWFAEGNLNQIAKITTSGNVTEYPAAISGGYPQGITTGPDGNLWYSEDGSPVGIGKINTSGAATGYTSGFNASAFPYFGIATGPDHNLWFTDCVAAIGKITTNGTVTEYSLTGLRPVNITAGPDGNLWFVEGKGAQNNRVGKITTGGSITEYTSGITDGAGPWDITVGPDGNLWFTENYQDRIAKITTSGAVTEYSAGITTGAAPYYVTTGPDGSLWFTENGGNRIGRMQ